MKATLAVKGGATVPIVRSNKKKPEANLRRSKSVRSKTTKKRTGDNSSRRMAGLGKRIGNAALGTKLSRGNAKRDAMLAFICDRLRIMHGVQQKELRAMKSEREWYRNVAKGTDGYHLPDTRRWHESAHLFKDAAQALCDGRLGRGASLLARAMEAEEAAYRSVPKMVIETLEAGESFAPTPDEATSLSSDSACTERDHPADLRYADQILNISDQMEPTPPVRLRRRWWNIEEEEEEEEEEAGKDGA